MATEVVVVVNELVAGHLGVKLPASTWASTSQRTEAEKRRVSAAKHPVTAHVTA